MKKLLLLGLSVALLACVPNESTELGATLGANQGVVIEDTSPPELTSKRIEMSVASEKVDCIGVMPMKCLVVNDQYFYDDINGFEFEAGYEYRLIVNKTQVFTADNTPADASLYRYELISILSKAAVR